MELYLAKLNKSLAEAPTALSFSLAIEGRPSLLSDLEQPVNAIAAKKMVNRILLVWLFNGKVLGNQMRKYRAKRFIINPRYT